MTLSLHALRDGHAAVAVHGTADAGVCDRIARLVRVLADAGVAHFRVDLSGAEAPDLRLVRLLHRLDVEAREAGGGVELAGVGPSVVPSWDGVTLQEAFALHSASRRGAA